MKDHTARALFGTTELQAEPYDWAPEHRPRLLGELAAALQDGKAMLARRQAPRLKQVWIVRFMGWRGGKIFALSHEPGGGYLIKVLERVPGRVVRKRKKIP